MRTKIPLAPARCRMSPFYIALNTSDRCGSAYVETDEAKADDSTIIENHPAAKYLAIRCGWSP